jgi:hypothetical protein
MKQSEFYFAYPQTVLLDIAKNIFSDTSEAEEFVKTVHYEFLLHDNMGRLAAYTATQSRYLPSATIAVDKLHEETKAEIEKKAAKTERF